MKQLFNTDIDLNLKLLRKVLVIAFVVFVFIHLAVSISSSFPCKHGLKMRLYGDNNLQGDPIIKKRCFALAFSKGSLGNRMGNFSARWSGYIYR